MYKCMYKVYVNRGNSEHRVIPNTSRIRGSLARRIGEVYVDLRLQLRIGLQVSFIKPESGGHIVRATVRNAKMIIVDMRSLTL